MLSPGKHHNALLVGDKGVLGRGPGLQGPAASLVRLLLAPGLLSTPRGAGRRCLQGEGSTMCTRGPPG